MIVFIICGATFNQKPSQVRQYLLPANITVWNGHNDLKVGPSTIQQEYIRFMLASLFKFAGVSRKCVDALD